MTGRNARYALLEWIEAQRDRHGVTGLEVVTADVNEFDPRRSFDRVVSVEMFEHMRNWSELLARIADWLAPNGRAFVHVFSHRQLAYRFEGTWAAERFFTAGTMPSHELLERFARDMVPVDRWAVSGDHYARTLQAWLERLDEHTDEALRILGADRSAREARALLATWRLFLISTTEIWGWRGGNEWMVSHYLLEPRRDRAHSGGRSAAGPGVHSGGGAALRGGNGKKPLVRATYSA